MAKVKVRNNFQQARWNEPVIYELSTPGLRGIIPPLVEDAIEAGISEDACALPDGLKRKSSLDLPEVAQKQVLEHFLQDRKSTRLNSSH